MLDNKGHACLGSCTKQISLLTESESRGYIYDMKILRLAILRLGSLAKNAHARGETLKRFRVIETPGGGGGRESDDDDDN